MKVREPTSGSQFVADALQVVGVDRCGAPSREAADGYIYTASNIF